MIPAEQEFYAASLVMAYYRRQRLLENEAAWHGTQMVAPLMTGLGNDLTVYFQHLVDQSIVTAAIDQIYEEMAYRRGLIRAMTQEARGADAERRSEILAEARVLQQEMLDLQARLREIGGDA